MTAPDSDLETARAEVAAAGRRLGAAGLVRGTSGNVSARAGDRVAISPTGARLGELTAEQVTTVDLDGRVLEADGLVPTSELDLHLACYRRFDAGAVVHTHAPAATALACVLQGELPCIHYEMLALGGAVPIAPYATFGTPELAAAVVETLAGRPAALMAHHGTLVHSGTLSGALELTELLEWCCEIYARAAAAGTPRALDADQLQAVLAAVAQRGYGATRPAHGSEA